MYRIINGNNKPTAESGEENFFNYLTPSFLKKPLTLPKRPLFFQIIDESTKKCVAGYVLNQKMLTLKACDIFDHSQLWSLYEGQLIPRSYGQIGDCLNDHGFFYKCKDIKSKLTWKFVYNTNQDDVYDLISLKVTNNKNKKSKCMIIQDDSWSIVHISSKIKLSFIHCTEAAFRYRIKVRSDMINNLYELTDHGTSVIQPNKVTGGKNDKCFSRFLKQIKKRKKKKEIKIAFFIRGHDNVDQTMRLIRRIYSKHHLYLVHYDKNAKEEDREELFNSLHNEFGIADRIDNDADDEDDNVKKSKNVYLLRPRDVDYMGFNLLFLDIAAIRTFVNFKIEWDYFINLSATEYPLISLRQMEKVLWHSYGNNFVDIWCPYELAPQYKKNRIDLMHNPDTLKAIDGIDRKKKHPVADEYMALGSFYVALTKEFCEYLFSNTKMIKLLSYMPGVKIPDELFFPTALSSSDTFRCTHVNTNFRFTAWGRSNLYASPTCSLKKAIIKQKGQSYYSGGSHPCILGIDEIKNEAKVSYPMAFFGNKFDLNIDGSEYAMNAIDIEIDDYEKELKSNKKKMEEEDTKIRDTFVQIERGWPHPLHCPDYKGAGH